MSLFFRLRYIPQSPCAFGFMSYRYESKGYQPDADYESANVAAVTAPGHYDSADDVFGDEEGAQVRSLSSKPCNAS